MSFEKIRPHHLERKAVLYVRQCELVVAAPVGFVKAGDRYEKDPDRRV